MSNIWGNIPGITHKSQVQKAVDWAKAHQQWIAGFFFLVLALSIGIPLYLSGKAQDEKKAQDELNLAQYYLQSRIDPVNGPFKSAVERDQHALQAFQDIASKYSGTSANKLALYFVAKCQFDLGQYQQAYGSFDQALGPLKESPLGAEAFYGKVLCLAAENEVPQAATLGETFLKEFPDSFIRSQVRLTLSDLYLKSKDPSKAQAQLKAILEKDPDSLWGKEAERRLKGFKS